MAENKKSFICYSDWINIFNELKDGEAGKLVKHMFAYVNDQNPELNNKLLKIAFEPIKQQLKRDLKKWEGEVNQKSNSGKVGNLKRWHKDLYEQFKSGKMTIDEALNIAENRKTSHSDFCESHRVAKIADTVNVTVTDTVIVSEESDNTKQEKWNTLPGTNQHSLELPEISCGAVVQQFWFTRKVTITTEQVLGLWKVFKVENFSGEKYYRSPKETFSHFMKWCKFQNVENIPVSNNQQNITNHREEKWKKLSKELEK